MLTKAKQFFKNPVWLLGVIVSVAALGVGSAFAFNAFADAPAGWTEDDNDAVTTLRPGVLYLDEGNYGDHVDVSFDVKRESARSSTNYKQINRYTQKTETTYYGVKARVSGSQAAYYWYDENGRQQNVINGAYDLRPYLPDEYTVKKVWDAAVDTNAKVWLYATKSVEAHAAVGGTVETINLSYCCASIPIEVYRNQCIGSDMYKKLKQSFDTRYSPSVVRSYCKSQSGYQTYTFEEAKQNWGCEDTTEVYHYDIGSMLNEFNNAPGDPTYSLVLGGTTDAPPIPGIVRSNSTVSAGQSGYYTPAIVAAYAPGYEYTVPITTTQSIPAEPQTVEGSSEDSCTVTWENYSSFSMKKSPAGGFYFTDTDQSVVIPYAESTSSQITENKDNHDIPDEIGEPTELYSNIVDGKLLRSQTISKMRQSYSTWTETQDSRTYTVTCTVKDGDGQVISTFTQPNQSVWNESETVGFMHITSDSGSIDCHHNTTRDLLTISGLVSSGSLSTKIGVKVRYDMSPLDSFSDVRYADNTGYVSSDHQYALENPVGDSDGNAAIISTYYSGIYSFMEQGRINERADDNLFSRTVKLSGTSDANKAPMYSANGTDYKMIDAWQLKNNGSDIFWPIGTHDMVSVTVGDLFKALSGSASYSSADMYDNAQNRFEFDNTTGLFLYTFEVTPIVGNTVSYVAEYEDSSGVTHNFPLPGRYLPSLHDSGSTVTVKEKLNVYGWSFDGWKIDESSLPSGVAIQNVVKAGDDVTSFTMPDCSVVLKGRLTPPDINFVLRYDTNVSYYDEVQDEYHYGRYDLSSTPTVPENSTGDEAPTQTFRLTDCDMVFYDYDDDSGVDYYNYEYTFPARTTTAEGYHFGGWYQDEYYGNVSPVTKISVNRYETKYTVYAIWQAKVTYKPNYTGATQPDVTDTYDVYDSSAQVRSSRTFTPPERATFKCWNTEADGTGYEYDYYIDEDDEEYSYGAYVYFSEGDVTLYAQWEYESYTLQYEKNTDAEVSSMPDNEDVTYADLNAAGGYALSETEPARTDGVSFLGWYLDSACTGSRLTAVTYAQAKAQKGRELEDGDTIHVYAKWGTASVSLQYEANTTDTVHHMPDPNPVTGLTPDSFRAEGGYALSDAAPTRTGYKFDGWYLDSACTGSKLTTVTYDQAVEQKGSNIVSGDTVHVYAKWEEWIYRVEYLPGTGHEDAQNMPAGRKTDGTEDAATHVQCFLFGDVHPTSHVSVSTEQPTHEGYVFTGWDVEKANGISKIYTVAELNNSSVSKILAENEFPENRTVTATAQWEEKEYVLSYAVNAPAGANVTSDGVPTPESKTFTQLTDGKFRPAPDGTLPAVDGYDFAGWKLREDASVAFDKTNSGGATVSCQKFVQDGETNTYKAVAEAQWTVKNLYTLRYHANLDGVTDPTSETFYADDANISDGQYTFPNRTVSKEGYTFKGWSASEGATDTVTTVAFDEGTPVYDVYGVWQNTVTYQDGYTGDAANDVTCNVFTGQSHSIIANPFTRTGYAFAGWQLVSPAAGYAASGSITVNENVTYKATWTANTHKVKYELTGENQPTVNMPETRQNVAYDIEFTDIAGKLEATGYSFSGWKVRSGDVDAANITNDTDGNVTKFIMPDNDVTLQGTFTKLSFTVSYRLEGSVCPEGWSVPTSYSVSYQAEVTPKPVPVYDTNRYDFEGWKKDGVLLTGTFNMPARDVELTGRFTENGTVSLFYDANRSESAEIIDALTVTDYTKVTTTIADLPGAYTRTGYVFAGKWNAQKNGGGEDYVKGADKEFSVNTTIYAVWNENTYQLLYDAGGATGAENLTMPADETDLTYESGAADKTVKNGKALSAVPPTATGKKFVRWEIDGEPYAAGATVPFAKFNTDTRTVTAVAIWSDWTYHLVYEKGSDHETADNMPEDKEYGLSAFRTTPLPAISTQKPTDEGYTFTGWSVAKKDGTELYTAAGIDNGEIMSLTDADFPAESLTIIATAQWEKNYTLEYYDGGTKLDGTQTAAYSDSFTGIVISKDNLADTAARIFLGWADTNGATVKQYDKDDNVPKEKFNAETHVAKVYAVWEDKPVAQTYTVTYQSGEGTGADYPDSGKSGAYTLLDASAVGFTAPDGKSFDGWKLIAPADKDYPATAQPGNAIQVVSDVTYEARWKAPEPAPNYRLIYDDNRAAYNVTSDDFYNEMKGITGIPGEEELTAAQIQAGYRLSSDVPDSDNYEFVGWGLTADRDTRNLLDSVGTEEFNGETTLTVYAKWKAKIIVTYSSGLNDGSNQTTTFVVDTYIVDGYTVKKNEELNPPFVNKGYEIKTWQVTEGNDLIQVMTAAPSGGSASTRYNTVHDPVNWLNPGDKVKFYGNITLTAKWTPIPKVTLTYDANGGSPETAVPNGGNPIEYFKGEEVTVKDGSGLTKNSLVFAYWSTTRDDVTDSRHYSKNDTFTIEENTTLYAIYKTAPGSEGGKEYTVTYDPNGGTGTTPTDPNKYKGGDTVHVLSKDGLVRTNATFKEWNTQKDGSGTGYAGDGSATFFMPENDVTLYAIWVDSSGKILPSPGTGESNLPLLLAFNMAALALLAAGLVLMRQLRLRRESAN